MSNWSALDIIGVGGIGFSAFFVALNSAIISLPALRRQVPTFLKHHFWGFLPIAFFLIGVGAVIYKQLRANDEQTKLETKQETKATVETYKWMYVDKTPSKLNVKKIFHNETVLLDDNAFFDCKFYNVTFIYNGTAPFSLAHSDLNGVWLQSENPAVNATLLVLKGIGFIRDDLQFSLPAGSNIQAPIRLPDPPITNPPIVTPPSPAPPGPPAKTSPRRSP